MILPSAVKIGGWTYTIESWSPQEANVAGKYAVCDYPMHRIKVDTSWGEKQTAASVLHEILHCICREWGIVSGDTEERMVEAMESGLIAAWYDNPEVFRWIGKAITEAT